eukprot:Opistho-2@92302
MHVVGMEDIECHFVGAVRGVVGGRCLLSASFDLHGNVTEAIAARGMLDMLCAFKTAPHIDIVETEEKACRMLVRCLKESLTPSVFVVPIPVLHSGERTSTEEEPAKSLYAGLCVYEQPPILDASLFIGYVWADEPRSHAAA